MKSSFYLSLVFIFFVVAFFFKPFLLNSKLPIPSDTIIGLYHPFRDLYAKDYPNGIPFKNFLITDPVRQQYPWKNLSIDLLKRGELPLWNPYSMAGSPLLANHQSAPFYALNILFFIDPFPFSWSLLIFLQPLLAALFMYLYLINLRVSKIASTLGALAFAFSGFSIAWMEWGTIGHVMVWLPLILLSIDKIFESTIKKISNIKDQILNIHIKNQKLIIWGFIFILSLASAFFAGHLQTFFYLFMVAFIYFIARWFQYGRIFNFLFVFFIFYILFFIFTSIQWVPTLQLIQESARGIDQIDWTKEGWFIPWQNLVQFIAPDFFGNPTTLNYFGAWNYAEFVGYIGILPLVFALFGLFFRKDRKTLFFGTIFFIGLVFSLPTIFAKIPYLISIPFISTTQPTRLLSIIDFSLAILCALGLDYFLKEKKSIKYPIGFLAIIFFGLWAFVLFGNSFMKLVTSDNLAVAQRNLVLPTSLFTIAVVLTSAFYFTSKNKVVTLILYCIIVGVTAFDLLRFGLKFTPFTNKEYLFPNTKVLSFLKQQKGQFRIMTTDSRIFPPNFSSVYKLQSVDGYDPLYLRRYGELIVASERGQPNIDPPFGFNRIITPHNYESKIIDLLGVKYILSLSDLSSPKLKKVFQEGQTRVYENKNALPRAFFVESVIRVDNNAQMIEEIFKEGMDLQKIGIIEKPAILPGFEGKMNISKSLSYSSNGKVVITKYSENEIIFSTENSGQGFLVFVDTYYPTWRAQIDGRDAYIKRADYNFRGVEVPKGRHTIRFYNTLF